jgi:hypothetical protein
MVNQPIESHASCFTGICDFDFRKPEATASVPNQFSIPAPHFVRGLPENSKASLS